VAPQLTLRPASGRLQRVAVRYIQIDTRMGPLMNLRVPATVRMQKRRRSVSLAMLLAALIVLGAACSSSPQLASSSSPPAAGTATTRTSEAGQVTIAVTWPGTGAGPVFDVVMDTHVVDLDGVDLRQLAVLRTEPGREVRPVSWEAPKGGHHRRGTLTFPATTADGSPLFDSNTRAVELIVRDVAGVPERSFRWTVS
jgi:hypothetical protein